MLSPQLPQLCLFQKHLMVIRIFRKFYLEIFFRLISRQITITGIVFGALILLHAIFQKKFFELTESFEIGKIEIKGLISGIFCFIFLLVLSIVFAVKISGVIPVFSYLIIPSVCAIMLARSNKGVVIIALVVSLLGSFIGLNVSFHFDFPAGSSIVATLGGCFILVSFVPLIKHFFFKKEKTDSKFELRIG